MSDDFLNVHGRETIMFSRVTETSSTRIDYVFSNSNSCNYFQYLNMRGLDHYAILARYDIKINTSKEHIPREKVFDGWVFPKILESDQMFIEQAEFLIKKICEESDSKSLVI